MKPPSLFRQQVLDKKRASRLEGEIEVSVGIGWHMITLFFCFIVLGIIVFVLEADFSKKESTIGLLAPEAGLVKVFALKPGEVKTLLVKEGQKVMAGQKLALIEVDPVMEGGAVMANIELSTLDQRVRETQDQIEIQEQHFHLADDTLRLKEENLKTQIQALTKSLDLQKGAIALVEKDVASARSLAAKGYLPRLELNKRENELQSEKIKLQTLELDLTQRQEQLIATQSDLAKLPMDKGMELSQLRSHLSELAQQKAGAQSRHSYEVLAPIAGTIDLIQAGIGQQISANLPMMAILPEGAALRAELFVPSRAIAYVQPGQEVRIAFDAFPYLRFGFAKAKINKVSYTLLAPTEIPPPLSAKEPVYRVEASLQQQEMHAFEKRFTLRPGMSLAADVILEKHSLATWIWRSAQESWNKPR